MARNLDGASSEYLELSSAPVANTPMTFAAWAYPTDVDNSLCVLTLQDSSVTDHRYWLNIGGNVAGDPVRAFLTDGGISSSALSSSGVTINTWHHCAAVFASSTSRSAYIDGGSKGTNTDTLTPTNMDTVAIGRASDLTPSSHMYGYVCEAGMWDVALTDAEVAILAAGYSPLFVRPQNLVAYWPLIRDEDQDRVGGYDMTAYNTPTVAEHPPIIHPASPYIVVPAAAAAAANIPEFMHHYQQQQQAG